MRAAAPKWAPFLGRPVLMPTSGSPIGSSPRATRASVSRAMSASLHWRSVSSICGSRVWSASAASLRAHSLSSGGILEWSGSMEFSPDAAISARIRTTIESIISAAGSLPGVLRDYAFKMSSCGLFRTHSRSDGVILIQSIIACGAGGGRIRLPRFYYAPFWTESLRTPSELVATMLE